MRNSKTIPPGIADACALAITVAFTARAWAQPQQAAPAAQPANPSEFEPCNNRILTPNKAKVPDKVEKPMKMLQLQDSDEIVAIPKDWLCGDGVNLR